MIRSKEEIEKAIQNLMEELIDTAKADNVISDDELAIINKIQDDLMNMQRQIFQVLESDLDDLEFRNLVSDFLEDTIKNAKSVAYDDNILTTDELFLLDKLEEIVHKMVE